MSQSLKGLRVRSQLQRDGSQCPRRLRQGTDTKGEVTEFTWVRGRELAAPFRADSPMAEGLEEISLARKRSGEQTPELQPLGGSVPDEAEPPMGLGRQASVSWPPAPISTFKAWTCSICV